LARRVGQGNVNDRWLPGLKLKWSNRLNDRWFVVGEANATGRLESGRPDAVAVKLRVFVLRSRRGRGPFRAGAILYGDTVQRSGGSTIHLGIGPAIMASW
jgi:hypothetical protein